MTSRKGFLLVVNRLKLFSFFLLVSHHPAASLWQRIKRWQMSMRRTHVHVSRLWLKLCFQPIRARVICLLFSKSCYNLLLWEKHVLKLHSHRQTKLPRRANSQFASSLHGRWTRVEIGELLSSLCCCCCSDWMLKISSSVCHEEQILSSQEVHMDSRHECRS